jgi:lysophospholipase L1-like esterase
MLRSFDFRVPLAALIALVAAVAPVNADPPPTTQHASQAEQQAVFDAAKKQPADTAALKLDLALRIKGLPNPGFGKPPPSFLKKHEQFLQRAREPVGLLFIGDSITEGWPWKGKAIWQERYAKYHPADFGIGGDQTQHVLWRIEHGELDHITPNPKVVVLLIGTNNVMTFTPASYTPEQIAAGITQIVGEIHAKLPDSKVLLLGVFPRVAHGAADTGPANPIRRKIQNVNELISKLDDGSKTRYLDLGSHLLAADGTFRKEIMPDGCHPNEKGYQIWADAMQPLLDSMMKSDHAD